MFSTTIQVLYQCSISKQYSTCSVLLYKHCISVVYLNSTVHVQCYMYIVLYSIQLLYLYISSCSFVYGFSLSVTRYALLSFFLNHGGFTTSSTSPLLKRRYGTYQHTFVHLQVHAYTCTCISNALWYHHLHVHQYMQ